MSLDANAVLPQKEPSAARFRRSLLFLAEIAMVYFFVWLPWRGSLPTFLLFFGVGMIQVSATYISTDTNSVTLGDTLLSLLVMLMAIGGLVAEFHIGWRSKSWWQALLLPVPPFLLAGLWFKSRDPAPPFFAALLFLLLALLLKIFV